MKVGTCKQDDEELIAMILKDQHSSPAVGCLYLDAKGQASAIAAKFQLAANLVHDLLTDSLIVLVDNVCQEKFRGGSSLRTYLLGIFKMHIRSTLRRAARDPESLDDDSADWAGDSDTLLAITQMEDHRQLHQCLEALGDNCRKLIRWWYFEEKILSFEEVAEKLGLKNAGVARNLRGRCLRTLHDCYTIRQAV